MEKYQLFFYSVFYFFIGVALRSLRADFSVVVLIVFLIFLFSFYQKSALIAFRHWWLVGFILLGDFYFAWHEWRNFQFVFNVGELTLLREKAIAAYRHLFNSKQAAFLAALTLGESEGLSASFLIQLSKSGTRHLVALSGLHLLIITQIINKTSLRFFSKGKSFLIASVFVFIFVAMTGFKVSAMRAAFMAVFLGTADLSERIYRPRNVIALTGLILILIDPRALAFDIGFQLSFAAVIGIIYLARFAFVQKFIKNKGLLLWRENLAITASAQFAVLPIIWYHFDQFAIWGLISNILILPIVPLTMFLGYVAGIVYYLFWPLAFILSWLEKLLINYIFLIVSLFS